MKALSYPPVQLAWTVWGLGAGLYLYAFFQRVAPGVMTTQLITEFNLSASALGNLSAFYFYTYVAMQLPTGILADMWGPRRLLTSGALLSAAGCLFFAFADSFYLAGIGRLMIGAAVSVAFVCMLKLANHWFAPKHFSLASGMALFTGIVGAVFAGVPLHLLMETFGWRETMAVSALFPLVVAIAIWVIVRDDPSERGYASHVEHEPPPDDKPWSHAMSGLLQVFKYRNIWLLWFVPSGVVGCIMSFAGLWGVPFLTTHHGLSKADAAAICSAMLIAWAVGGPILGALSDRISLRKPIYILGCSIIAILWSVILIVPDMPIGWLIAVLLCIGFASGCMIVGFAFTKESVPSRLSGTASGFVNMGVMMGPMILQPAVGWMLDMAWNGEMVGEAKIFSLSAYQSGFALMAGWAILSLILIFFTRETHGQNIS